MRGAAFNVDPVEDFVSNHHMGHCEYFASALTLMLRSQGIPARMVVGYKGGEFNYVGNYFVVRQQDAHAWVEAYLKPEEIPADAICPEERHAGGGWLRLDPTPAVEDERAEERSLLDRASKSFDYARWLWNDYVLRLTSARQQRVASAPAGFRLRDSHGGPAECGRLERLAEQATGTPASQGSWQGPFNWRGVVAALLACALAYGGYKLVRVAWPVLARAARARRSIPARKRRRAVASTSGWSPSWRRSACAAGQGRRSASSPVRPPHCWPPRPTRPPPRRFPKPSSARSIESGSAIGFPMRNRKPRSPRSCSGWNTSITMRAARP